MVVHNALTIVDLPVKPVMDKPINVFCDDNFKLVDDHLQSIVAHETGLEQVLRAVELRRGKAEAYFKMVLAWRKPHIETSCSDHIGARHLPAADPRRSPRA
ncbi:hypothetical protein IWX75_001803 [Arthrobacter sp. CAN_A6]|uniref:hypothetical protein n=1 Tax=Arthrobacter sp. CAN_A6 TaxID=2787721 RepID=UPI0018C96913